jgi:hypothetical protein
MIDPAVERQYSDSKELLALWRVFHDFFVMGVKAENITPEKEAQFLELKSKIAMLHDSFMEALTHDQNIGQEVLGIVSRAITLKHLSKQSAADIKKMEIEWHESYLLLNETIGGLEDKRAELANVNQAQYRASKAAGVAGQNINAFLTSFWFKAGVVIVIVLAATVGVQMLGIYDYNQLGKIPAFKTPYRLGVNIFRSISPDIPWVTIAVGTRKDPGQWPVGLKAPEVRSDSKEEMFREHRLPQAITQILSKATEYRKEVTSKEFRGEAQIHSFLLPTMSDARQVDDEWRKFTESPAAARLRDTARMVRDNNIVIILTGQKEMIDSLADEVYK